MGWWGISLVLWGIYVMLTICTTSGASKEKSKRQPSEQETPYSIYTPKEKWLIVVIASIAGIFR